MSEEKKDAVVLDERAALLGGTEPIQKKCDGSGAVPISVDDWIECSECNGSGCIQYEKWHMASGDWKEDLVSLHGPQGHIVSGLTVAQARAIINAHGGFENVTAANPENLV